MILFTPPNPLPNEQRLIHLFLENGLKTLHVRKPDYTKEEFIEYIEQIDEKYHPNLMIHQYPELVKQFDLKGISFTGKTKALFDEYKELARVKSWSVHGIEELEKVPDGVDYVFLSPVFQSISKAGYERKWELTEFRNYLEKRKEEKFKIIALGGITSQNYQEVLKMGFDDVAVLGSVWENEDFQNSTKINENIILFLSHFN